MSKVLIIGCGGVASVAIHKCCQVPEEMCIRDRCTTHGGHAGGVADGLTAHFLVALLMVTDVVDVVGLILTVLFAGKDAADVGLALSAGAKAGGVRQKSLEELDGHDLLSVEVDRGDVYKRQLPEGELIALP